MNALQTITLGRRHGVSPSLLHALLAVISDPPMTPTDIARTCGVSTAAVTGAVDKLESLGMLERVIGDADRRVRKVLPTYKAFRLFEQVVADIEAPNPFSTPAVVATHASDASLQNSRGRELAHSLS